MIFSKPRRLKYGLLTVSALLLTLKLWDSRVQAVELATKSALESKGKSYGYDDDESECESECEEDGIVYSKPLRKRKKKSKKK